MNSSFKKIGFFSALILPVLLIAGYYIGGLGIFSIHLFVFLLVPIMDFLIDRDRTNIAKEAVSDVAKERFYRWVTYGWVYVQMVVLFWGFHVVSSDLLTPVQWIGIISGMGLITGGIGITVAHELGHKNTRLQQFYAKILLMTVCYMHFFIEHNRGHHVRVATIEDPATSREGEHFYAFWLRSIRDGYRSAWHLEGKRLEKKSERFWSIRNQMFPFTILPLVFVGLVFGFFSLWQDRIVWEVLLLFFGQSLVAISLLEAVNYLEHYGMERKKLPNGFYEKVTPLHSWNASQRVSNFLLFQLQRHSDHHAFAHKPYQVLNHYEESPQLPAGYSAMILVAFIPPIWFAMMDPRLEAWKTKSRLSVQ
ncbi:alkane 1-monooxygenase [Algoriphagus hitonicola]|nr:alkane 1-monooxygenase [Algoriphagus hitonicola]